MNVKTQRRILVTAIVTKQERSMGNNQDRKDLKSKKQEKMPTYVHMIHTIILYINVSYCYLASIRFLSIFDQTLKCLASKIRSLGS